MRAPSASALVLALVHGLRERVHNPQFDRNSMDLAMLRCGKDLMTLVRFSNSDLESCFCVQYLLNSWTIDLDGGVASVIFFLKRSFNFELHVHSWISFKP